MEKKNIFCGSMNTLCTQTTYFCLQKKLFYRNCVFASKVLLAIKIFFCGKFNTSQKLFCSGHQKNANHRNFINGSCNFLCFMCDNISKFMPKTKENFLKIKWLRLSKFYFHRRLPRLRLWNCLTCIFGLWRSTRAVS